MTFARRIVLLGGALALAAALGLLPRHTASRVPDPIPVEEPAIVEDRVQGPRQDVRHLRAVGQIQAIRVSDKEIAAPAATFVAITRNGEGQARKR